MAPIAGLGIRFIGGLVGFQVLFLASFVLGAISTVCYARIHEGARPPQGARRSGSTGALLKDDAFVRFMASTFVLHTATMVVGPFLTAYLVRELHTQPGQVELLSTVEAGAAVVGQFILGYFIVRSSAARLFRWLSFAFPLIPLLWLLPQTWWHAIVPNIAGGAGWAAYNALSFNLLMEHAPADNIPRYAAAQQTIILAASFLGPALGTWIVATWDIRTAMVVSAAGRLFATLLLATPARAQATTAPSTAGG